MFNKESGVLPTMCIGKQITSLRNASNITQEELAEKVGVSRQAVTKWELDESTPTLSKIIALADVFGVSIDKLVGHEETLYDLVKNIVCKNSNIAANDDNISSFIHKFIQYCEANNMSADQIVEGILFICKMKVRHNLLDGT